MISNYQEKIEEDRLFLNNIPEGILSKLWITASYDQDSNHVGTTIDAQAKYRNRGVNIVIKNGEVNSRIISSSYTKQELEEIYQFIQKTINQFLALESIQETTLAKGLEQIIE